VSTPVRWEEVEQLLKKKDPSLLVFEAEQVIKRVEKLGDLFEPTLKLKQKLPKFPGSELGSSSASKSGLQISAQAEPKPAIRKSAKPVARKTAPASRQKAAASKKRRKT
jgi:hypothetical protein